MKTRLRLPLLLLIATVAVASIGVGVARCAVFSKYEKPRSDSVRATEADQRRAVEIVRASGIVERINDNQSWDAMGTLPSTNRRVVVFAEWAEPVESSGPWQWTRCEIWRQRVQVTWRNIRYLNLFVDVAEEEVINVNPASPTHKFRLGSPDWLEHQPKRGRLNPFTTVKVWEIDSGNTIYRGPYILSAVWPGPCPWGFGYRD